MKTELATINQLPISDLMTLSKSFAESGMFQDTKSAAQAIVKIQAGQEIGIPPFQAMTGIHIIAGKPVIGAGLIAARVKGSGKYDYKVTEQSDTRCAIDFYQSKEKIGTSEFTIADAKKAGTKNIEKFPKNMLFARAISNGVKWYCPDVFAGPVYVPEEIEAVQTEDTTYTEVPPTAPNEQRDLKPTAVESKVYKSALAALRSGKSIEEVEQVAADNGWCFPDDVKQTLLQAAEEVA